MSRALLLAGLACLASCAELTQRPQAPPGGLAMAGDPVRSGAEALVRAFGDGGRALNGQPAEMALAVARLEYMTDALRTDPQLAAVPEAARFQLVAARRETRGALGMAESVPPATAVSALLATSQALRARNEPAARSALAPLVRPGGLPPLDRLADMGGLPQAAQATVSLRDEMARLDLDRGWNNSILRAEGSIVGISTVGLGGGTDR
ncbi:MAG: hypothetical protein H7345_20160 [Rubritepida sp.]|nr:hypothetical protein [Rubritepida sp.]